LRRSGHADQESGSVGAAEAAPTPRSPVEGEGIMPLYPDVSTVKGKR